MVGGLLVRRFHKEGHVVLGRRRPTTKKRQPIPETGVKRGQCYRHQIGGVPYSSPLLIPPIQFREAFIRNTHLCLHVECGKELTLVDRFYNGREPVTNREAGSTEKRVEDYLAGESVAVAKDPFCPGLRL